MELTSEPISASGRKEVMDIFNYCVENGLYAYPEHSLPYEFFDTILNLCKDYPSAIVRNTDGEIIGFGQLRLFNPFPTFSQTAEVTYFVKPGFTGQGIRKAILDLLTAKAREKGLTSLLVSISSLNEASIRFHLHNGFVECGIPIKSFVFSCHRG